MSSINTENTIINKIENKIKNNLQATFLQVQDKSINHAGHYAAIFNKEGRQVPTHLNIIVQSPLFESLSEVECHRAIYKELQEDFDDGLHAVSIKIKRN